MQRKKHGFHRHKCKSKSECEWCPQITKITKSVWYVLSRIYATETQNKPLYSLQKYYISNLHEPTVDSIGL